MTPTKKQEIVSYIENRIHEVIDWYSTGAEDSPETRRRVVEDAKFVLREAEKKFHLHKIPDNIGVDFKDGIFIVTCYKEFSS